MVYRVAMLILGAQDAAARDPANHQQYETVFEYYMSLDWICPIRLMHICCLLKV